jgi:transglutaminase-like putative cysteine protease
MLAMSEWATAPGFLTLQPSADAPNERLRVRAKLDRLFEIALFLLVATGFFAIAFSGSLDGISVALVSMALFVRAWFLAARKQVSIPESWDVYVSVAYIAFYIADYFLGSRSFVGATVHLVLFSMVMKLFSIRRDRDYVYLAVLAFLQILAACILTVNAIFVAVFAVFAMLAVFVFIAFEMRRSWTENDLATAAGRASSASTPDFATRRLPRSMVGFTLSMALGILVIGSGLFFVLPRVSAGYIARFSPRNAIVSGFSEQVRLGQIGEIQQSSAVVMHVQIADGSETPAMYWRGLALSLFDGKQWFNPLQRNAAEIDYAGKFDIGRTRDGFNPAGGEDPKPSARARLMRYRVLMEPIGTNVFFFAPFAVSLEGNYRSVTIDDAGAVFNADGYRPIDSYEAVSDVTTPTAEHLRLDGQDYPASISLKNLQLPPRLDRRIPELAAQVTAKATNPYDRARAIEEYLESNFGYTLQLPKTPSDDPLAQFLFERKKGHCEYFASAMAVMLRTIGIPSRIVNGFHGGEFNDLTGSYIVRARDAHSWVEAYFPGDGWVAFDPTPASSLNDAGYSRLALYLDAMHEFWREWVVNYDFSHQRTLGSSAAERSANLSRRADRWAHIAYLRLLLKGFRARSAFYRHPLQWGALAVCLALVVLMASNARRLRRAILVRRVEEHPANAPELAASVWYEKMVQVVGRRGWHKLPSQTATEFAETITDITLRESVSSFTAEYSRARFGRSAEAAQLLRELLKKVEVASQAGAKADSSLRSG